MKFEAAEIDRARLLDTLRRRYGIDGASDAEFRPVGEDSWCYAIGDGGGAPTHFARLEAERGDTLARLQATGSLTAELRAVEIPPERRLREERRDVSGDRPRAVVRLPSKLLCILLCAYLRPNSDPTATQ